MQNLHKTGPQTRVKILSTPDSPSLESIGILPGAVVMKHRTYGRGGPSYVELGNRYIAVGREYAEQIEVEEV